MKEKAKRKGETLIEAVVSIAVFGILLLGLTDFMSAQLSYVARLRHRDELINKAQVLIANDFFKTLDKTKDFVLGDEVIYDKDKKILTLRYNATKKQTDEIQFALP